MPPKKDASNLFARLAEQRQADATPPELPAQTATPPATPAPAAAAPDTPRTEPTPKGRAKGKRSDPNYVQVGVYLPKALKKECDRRLLDEEIDFSELVAKLLNDWVSD